MTQLPLPAKPQSSSAKPFALLLLLLVLLAVSVQEVVQRLQHENEALKQQLKQPKQQQQALGSHDSSSASTHANGISSSSRGVSRSGIVDLNVAGTAMTTSITALQQVCGVLDARALWPDCVRPLEFAYACCYFWHDRTEE
jgi:hypothetical protein